MDEKTTGAATRGSMSFYALIPLAAILVSAAFGAVAVAWNSDRRGTAPICGVFICTGAWALLDLMTFLETDAARAQFWMEWIHLPALMLGPMTTWLLGDMLPQISGRLYRLARVGFGIALVLGVSAALLPGSILEVVLSETGIWMPRYGIGSILLVPIGTVLPLIAGYEASRVEARRQFEKSDRIRARAVTVGISLSLMAAMLTEYIMPLLEVPAPRLGAIGIALASAVLWLLIVHATEGLAMTPEGMARSMLDELHAGVVLVQLDGTIRASNARFAEMVGRRSTILIGTSIVGRVGTPLSEICAGLEDRECSLETEEGESLPISLTSSVARDDDGNAVGAAMVFRDRREIEGLRRRLVTSGRLAAIGELAAGIAHEVNNPIAFIRSDFNLLSQRLEELRDQIESQSCSEMGVQSFDRAGRRLSLALDGIERVAEVVGDVRDFAHVGGAGQGGSDPAVLVEGAMRLARLQRGDDIELSVVNNSCSEWIESGQELKQVLLALILNLVGGLQIGGAIEASLESDGKILGITLAATGLAENADGMRQHFERLAAAELATPHSELGLAIATELIDQMGASFSIAEMTPDVLALVLQLPLDGGSIS